MGKIDIPQTQQTPAEKVESKAPEKQENVTSDEIAKTVLEKVRDEVVPMMDDAIELIPLRQYFDLDGDDVGSDKQVRDVMQHLRNDGAHTRLDMVAKLKEIEMKLGRSHTKEQRLSKIHTYVRLQDQLRDTIRKMSSIEKRTNL